MNGLLVLERQDIRRLPLSWYREPHDRLCKQLKQLTGNPWDNPRTKYEFEGYLFSFMLKQQQTMPNSIMYQRWRRQFPNFAVLGEPKPSGYVWTNVWEVHTWDTRGTTSIWGVAFCADPDQPLPDTVRKELERHLRVYLKGYRFCSDCGEKIKQENVAGRFYAGIYCAACWERKWKERAANENYD